MKHPITTAFIAALWLITALPATAALRHPYLLMDSAAELRVRKAVDQQPVWRDYHRSVVGYATKLLGEKTLDRVDIGRRILVTSRASLHRVLSLAYTYRMTGDKRYARRCEQELLREAAFTDWNPSHFLDVAEMTASLAIGYDWIYKELSPESRELIETAIVQKGLAQSFVREYNEHWLDNIINWNQVCHGGMVLGALAVKDLFPMVADDLVRRAVGKVKIPMAVYAANGAYPEGYAYWAYGTTYNIMLIEALRSVFGTDYGLSREKGFLGTARWTRAMVLNDGRPFNYGDCSDSDLTFTAMQWFARECSDPSLLWSDVYQLRHYDLSRLTDYTYSVLALIWGADIDYGAVCAPKELVYAAPTATEALAVMRTTWQFGEGLSAAVKGGTAQAGHQHLDAGSFILTSGPVRWAMDFGPQDYHSIERLGMDLWGRGQQSQRWTIFRYNNMAHNTLSFDGQLQNALSHCPLTAVDSTSARMSATVNLTPAYEGQVAKAVRRLSIERGRRFAVEDTVVALPGRATVMRWNMLTSASARVIGRRDIELTNDGRRLRLHIEGDAPITAKTWPTTPPASYDAPNPGTTFVGFEAPIKGGKTAVFRVSME